MNNWQTWTLAGHVLEYNDVAHSYICDGVFVPSVTRLLGMRFGHKYDGIPRHILQEAARKGTLLHGAIENAEKSGNASEYDLSPEEWEIAAEFGSYLFLKQENGLTIEGNELPLLIPYKGEVIAAGRMDILATNRDGGIGVIDVKRTAKLDKDYLAYQLTMYGMGVEYCYNVKPAFHSCLWLREDKRKYQPIDPCEDLVNELLEEYVNEVRR